VWLSTHLATRQPITEQCLLGSGRIGTHAQLCTAGTGSYSDTPYSDSSYSDNSYSAAKVFMQVMFVTVTVPLGVTLYASCRRPFQHVYFSTVASVCYSLLFYCTCFVGYHPRYVHIFPTYFCLFSLIVGAYLGIFRIFFAHISCLYTAHIWEIVARFSGFPRYITHSVTGFPG